MKKRSIALFVLTFILTGCGNASNPSTTTIPPTESLQSESSADNTEHFSDASETNVETEKQDVNENSEDVSGNETEKNISDIESYLLDKGVLQGERIQMGAELIGAISGFKYKDSIGEVYEYDTNSEEYKKLSNGEAVSIEGMEGYAITPASINGKFVLFGESIPQDFIDAFNAFE